MNLSIIKDKILLSVSSSPALSIPRASKAFVASLISTSSLPETSEKSLTLLSILFAILGVPLDLLAISEAALSFILIPRIPADLFTICLSSSFEYRLNLLTIPNLSLRGAVRFPALVVAPTSVNLGMSSLIDLAEGPFPMIMSIA